MTITHFVFASFILFNRRVVLTISSSVPIEASPLSDKAYGVVLHLQMYNREPQFTFQSRTFVYDIHTRAPIHRVPRPHESGDDGFSSVRGCSEGSLFLGSSTSLERHHFRHLRHEAGLTPGFCTPLNTGRHNRQFWHQRYSNPNGWPGGELGWTDVGYYFRNFRIFCAGCRFWYCEFLNTLTAEGPNSRREIERDSELSEEKEPG